MNGQSTYLSAQGDEGRYRLLVENIVDYAIYMLDPNGFVVSWNAGAERFKGYPAHEIMGEHFSRLYTEEDQKTGPPARALEIARTEGKFDHEGWRVRKDGTRFWASVIVDPVRDHTGNLVGYAKITRDLTERKKAEASLLASEQQFRLLVQSVTDYAIYMLDTKGFVASWNSGAARIKGYHADEIIGAHFSKFYTPEDREAGLPERALQTAEHEGRFVREGWRVRKDGSRFWASVVIDPIRSDDGALIGFAKVTRDVTERLEAERALEQTREALFQSQKLEAIGQLTGGVAHDFNNLLSAAMGSLELIGKRLPPDDERLRALHENAFAGLKRRSSLTQRMLAFARRQDLKFEVLPVSIAGEGLHRPCRKLYGLRELGIVWSKRRVRSDYSGERVNSRHDGRGRRLSNHLAFVCKTAEHDLRQFAVKACGLLFESRTVQRVGTLRLFFARYSIQPYDP